MARRLLYILSTFSFVESEVPPMVRSLKMALLVGLVSLALGTTLHAGPITCIVGPCTGPTGDYYVTDGVDQTFFLLNGTSDTIFPAYNAQEYAIALDPSGTYGFVVSLMSRTAGLDGGVYTPNGSLLLTLPQPNTWSEADDGTTDGTYNYFLLWSTNQVYQATPGPLPDWTIPSLYFVATGSNPIGITYDPTNSSFWVSDTGDNEVYDESWNGSVVTVLSSFTAVNPGANGHASLALDPTDGTLWMSVGYTNTFEQYTKSGTLLQELTYNHLDTYSGNIYGGEAIGGMTPEPGTWMLLSSGIGALGLLRRKRVE
jgi:hypothetical protein